MSIEQIQILKEILKKNNYSTNKFFTEGGDNNYATLERASFFLEQERAELDQILLSYTNAKDEITEFLNKKVNLDSINPSGVIKFLQNVLKESKVNSLNINQMLEKGYRSYKKYEIYFFYLF